MNNNRVVLTIVIIVAVACVCLAAIVAVSTGVFVFAGDKLNSLFATPTPATLPVTPTPAAPLTLPTPITGVTATPGAGTTTDIPADVAAQMDQIQNEVSQLRGLKQPPSVQRALLTVDQLREQVKSNFFKDYKPDEVADDVRVLSSFGLLAPGYDLYDLYLNLYTEQIAGYYDLDSHEMFVVLDQGFQGPQRSTYAHEFTHVLQDYDHNVRQGLRYTEEYCKTDSEYCAAIQSLIEGDASITEQAWLYNYGTDQDRSEIDKYYQDVPLSVYDSAPPFLKEDFVFPYRQGVDFVLTLFENGGFTRVDQAYADPPTSTEQILHPDRYPDDKPVTVTLPDLSSTLGRDLRELDKGVMGEWYTYLILGHGVQSAFQLPDDQAKSASDGWGGDAYAVYWDETAGKPVVALYTVWDTADDAAQFATAFPQYATARWGNPDAGGTADQTSWSGSADGVSIFQHSGKVTVWVMAPSASDAGTVLQTVLSGTK